jgi:hypothetical protein
MTQLNHQPKRHTAVRLDLDTLARIDALLPRFSTRTRPATRSDVLRELLVVALDVGERCHARHLASVARRRKKRGNPPDGPATLT